MILAFPLLLAVGVGDDVAKAFNEPGCPALGALYTDDMAKAVGAGRASFCDSVVRDVGKVLRAEPVGSDGSWQLYVLHAERGRLSMKLATTSDGRVSGLVVNAYVPPLRVVKAPLGWPIGNGKQGDTFVFWGGASKEDNTVHVDNARQRRALDLCAMDGSTGKTHSGDGSKNSDYFIYGAPVIAAAAGTVHVVIDGVPDNAPSQMNRDVVPGNLVVIDHGNGEYAHYAHLVPGSMRVKVGQRVTAGDTLGLVGNSGNSSEPHLHFHVQDNARIDHGAGVDIVFNNVIVDGKARDNHAPKRGERIRAR